MELDLQLFHDFEHREIPSTLRLYSWQPNCVSLGFSQKIENEIDEPRAAWLGYDVVKRPTGGGIVFHNEAEVTYSLVTAIDNPLLPKGLIPAYKKISEAVVYGLVELGIAAEITTSPADTSRPPSPFSMERGMNSPKAKKGVRNLCFSYPAEYEIVANGKKIVGSAQKRGRRALLQQGSIFVRQAPREIFSILRKSYAEHNAVSVEDLLGRQVGFEEMSKALVEGFEECFGIRLINKLETGD